MDVPACSSGPAGRFHRNRLYHNGSVDLAEAVYHMSMYSMTDFVILHFPDVPPCFLNTIKHQQAMDTNSAEATIMQQLSPPVNRKLGHRHHADILVIDTSFLQ